MGTPPCCALFFAWSTRCSRVVSTISERSKLCVESSKNEVQLGVQHLAGSSVQGVAGCHLKYSSSGEEHCQQTVLEAIVGVTVTSVAKSIAERLHLVS